MAAAYEKSPAVEQPAYVGAHSPDSRSEEDVPYDSNDPMRWSWVKKHVYLTIVVMAAFLPDYASSSGIPLLQQQVKEWHQKPAVVQRNLSGGLATIGLGGLFVISFASYFGRLPVLSYFLALGLASIVWCGEATSLTSYIAARSFNGFFSTVAQAGGLMWIQDMFKLEDHPRKINILSSAIIVSPYFGPLIGSFIAYYVSWRWDFRVLIIMFGVVFLLAVGLLDETYYPRGPSARHIPPPRSRVLRIFGIEQVRTGRMQTTAVEAILRPFLAASKAPVFLSVVFFFMNFFQIVGVNATVGIWLEEFYHFSVKSNAYFYFAGIIGVVIGWIIGHFAYDLLGRTYFNRYKRQPNPEFRLLPTYVGCVAMVIALVIMGFALERRWHYMVVAVCYSIQVIGMLMTSVSVNGYLLQAYPEASCEIGTWVNIGRAFGGFMATYLQIEWVEEKGPSKVLGTQAGIVAASVVIIAFLQVFGERIRYAQGPVVKHRAG